MNYTINCLKSLYEIRTTEVGWFLGVQINWVQDTNGTAKCVFISQPLYIESILRHFGMETSKPVSTPMIEAFWTSISSEEDKSIINVKVFERMIGYVLYLALRTRPDILPAVLMLARFQKTPQHHIAIWLRSECFVTSGVPCHTV